MSFNKLKIYFLIIGHTSAQEECNSGHPHNQDYHQQLCEKLATRKGGVKKTAKVPHLIPGNTQHSGSANEPSVFSSKHHLKTEAKSPF